MSLDLASTLRWPHHQPMGVGPRADHVHGALGSRLITVELFLWQQYSSRGWDYHSVRAQGGKRELNDPDPIAPAWRVPALCRFSPAHRRIVHPSTNVLPVDDHSCTGK